MDISLITDSYGSSSATLDRWINLVSLGLIVP